jgi:hypothetical protein
MLCYIQTNGVVASDRYPTAHQPDAAMCQRTTHHRMINLTIIFLLLKEKLNDS